MVTFAEGVKSALRAFPCFALANGEYAYGFAGAIFPLSPAGRVADGIGQLRRLIGCDPDDDPPEPDPPFTGGQCDGVCYEVTVTSDSSGNEVIQTRGPIGGVRGITLPGGGSLEIFSRSGVNFTNSTSCLGLDIPAWRPTGLGGTAWAADQNPRIVSVAVKDNIVPDDCGDPPIIYPPPTNINTDVDVTYNIEEGDEVTVTIPFVFAPVNVDLSGNFRIPFNFEFGGFEFSGTLEIAPSIEVNINPPSAPRGTGDGTDDLPGGDPGDEVDPTPPSEKIIGVAVVSVLVGEQRLTTIATTDIPTIYAPRAGSIKFAYSIGVSTFWSDDIDIKGERTFIPCPFSQGADFVAVSPAPGVEVDWRAVTGYAIATTADVA